MVTAIFPLGWGDSVHDSLVYKRNDHAWAVEHSFIFRPMFFLLSFLSCDSRAAPFNGIVIANGSAVHGHAWVGTAGIPAEGEKPIV